MNSERDDHWRPQWETITVSQQYIADSCYVQVFMPLTTPDACYSKSSSQTSSNNLFNTIDKMGSKEIICFPVPRNKSKAEHGNTFTLWVKVMAPIEIKAFKDELIFSVLSCLNQAHAYRHENSLPSHVGTEPFYCCLSPSSSWQRPLLHRQTQRLYWQKKCRFSRIPTVLPSMFL